jgi:tetratricopeptide (TPR) repeat protein/Zn-dependent protease with chaperone function
MLPDRHSTASDLRLRRALLFAALGYGYVVAVLALLAGILVLMARNGLGIVAWYALGGLGFFVVRALLVGIAPAEGVPVTREECPTLFRTIDRARGELRAPPVDAVFITHELNASVLERPRFGLAGWNQRYLTLGLPLFHALPADELHAILGHEFAHLSRRHGRSRRWLVRAGGTWQMLVVGFASSFRWAGFLFIPFFRWYTPRLESLTQEASRAHELESDRLAARVPGVRVQARALLRLALCNERMAGEILPAAYRGSLEAEAPDAGAFAGILRALREPLDVAKGVRVVLRDHTLDTHSHPSLADRLAALGVEPAEVEADLRRPFARSAADELLADAPPGLEAAVAATWVEEAAPVWRQCHIDAREWTAARRAAEETPDAGLSPEALWARARWASHCEPDDVAIAALRRVAERVEARVLLGTLLLRHNDPARNDEGVRLLEEESRGSGSALAVAANEALEEFYARVGWERDLRRCRERRMDLRAAAIRAVIHRATLLPRDTLRASPLTAAEHASLAATLRGVPDVSQAFRVQKRALHRDDPPSEVLAVVVGVPWYRYSSGRRAIEVCERLFAEPRLPASLDLIVAVEPRSALHRRLRRLPGAEVHPLGNRAPSTTEWSAPPRVPVDALTFGGAALGAICLVSVVATVAALLTAEPNTPEEWAAEAVKREAEVRENRKDPEARRRLAWALVEADRWKEARPALIEAVRLNPRDADLLNSLGWSYIHEGKPEESLSHFQRALAIDPTHTNARHNLGWALLTLGRYAEAETEYRATIRQDPSVPNAHAELGWILYSLNRFEEAERELREARRLDPADASTHRMLGIVQKARGQLPASLASFREAVRLDPRDGHAWGQIALLTHLNRDFRASAAAFDSAARIDPHFVDDPYTRDLWKASREGRLYTPPE